MNLMNRFGQTEVKPDKEAGLRNFGWLNMISLTGRERHVTNKLQQGAYRWNKTSILLVYCLPINALVLILDVNHVQGKLNNKTFKFPCSPFHIFQNQGERNLVFKSSGQVLWTNLKLYSNYKFQLW